METRIVVLMLCMLGINSCSGTKTTMLKRAQTASLTEFDAGDVGLIFGKDDSLWHTAIVLTDFSTGNQWGLILEDSLNSGLVVKKLFKFGEETWFMLPIEKTFQGLGLVGKEEFNLIDLQRAIRLANIKNEIEKN